MKKLFNIFFALLLVAITTACDDELDITPKGKTTLSSVTDLEYLLNQNYSLGTTACCDLGMVCNESLGLTYNIDETLSQPNTLNYAYLTFDESVDRITLTQSDARYNAIYSYINYMNTVIEKNA